MIIGRNNNNNHFGNQKNFGNQGSTQGNGFNTQFQERFQMIQDQAKKQENQFQQTNNPVHSKNSFFSGNNKPADIMNSNSMADKSLDILKDRLDRNLISLDEFNQKAKRINQFREK
ncbi:MAG: SHOCT domain-containing protein [Bacilli bacterium]|nr:SHOCT domain-containing protein [Bacilli bacterium]